MDSAIQCLNNRGLEKIEKSQFLEKRNRKVVEGEVKVVPIVIEALGAVSDMFEKLNVAIRLEVIDRESGSVGNSWTITESTKSPEHWAKKGVTLLL